MKHTGVLVISGLSILYITVIFLFRGDDVWNLLQAGDLNELGDFLAGFFTPLAFGWLVYGYLLQSKELRLQRKELALTRDQLGKQTELLQEQATVDYQDSIPRLTIRVVNQGDWWNWIVENKGGNAKNVELLNFDSKQIIDKRNSLPRDDCFRFTLGESGPSRCYEARFSSERSERFRQCWEIGEGNYTEITHGPEPLGTEK